VLSEEISIVSLQALFVVKQQLKLCKRFNRNSQRFTRTMKVFLPGRARTAYEPSELEMFLPFPYKM
jgi:hypothetical protein